MVAELVLASRKIPALGSCGTQPYQKPSNEESCDFKFLSSITYHSSSFTLVTLAVFPKHPGKYVNDWKLILYNFTTIPFNNTRTCIGLPLLLRKVHPRGKLSICLLIWPDFWVSLTSGIKQEEMTWKSGNFSLLVWNLENRFSSLCFMQTAQYWPI